MSLRSGTWQRKGAAAMVAGAVCAGLMLLAGVPAGATGSGTGLPPDDAAQVAPSAGALAALAQPNIVVVMLDDMRSDELRFAPNALRYVRDRGLDFRNSFSPYPLCCPARASFLLGKYAHNHGVVHHEAPYGFGSLDDRTTIAGRLREAGYSTALVGKYLNGYGEMKSRVTGGSSLRYVPRGWTDWYVGLEHTWPAGSPFGGGTYNYFHFTQNQNGRVVANNGAYSSDVIGAQTRGLIEKYHRAERPFFLWVTPVAPHHGAPVEPDDPGKVTMSNGRQYDYVTPARPSWVKGRFDASITHGFGQPVDHAAEADIADKPRFFRRVPEATRAERRALTETERQRAESIYAWDVQFGKIVQTLKKTGEYDNTVLVFTSDNGYYLGEHRQRLGKILAHEPVIHVPLLVAGPAVRHGARYTPITTMDLTATVLDLAGARPLPAMDGASKLPSMRGPDRAWTTAVVTEGLTKVLRPNASSGVPRRLTTSGIRTGRYKLIRYSTGEGELYDLVADPNELRSRFRDPAYAGIRAELERLWRQYRSCARSACRVPLPASLRTTPSALAAQYRHARAQQDAYYNR